MAASSRDPDAPTKIGELNQYSRGVNVVVKVIMKTDTRTVTVKADGSQHRVCEALVADDTGAVYVSLWDDHVDQVQPDMVLAIRNAYMNAFRGSMRMNIGRYGSYEVLPEAPFDGVNTDNNLSAERVEYEDPRKRGYGDRDRYTGSTGSYGRGRY